MVVVVRQVWASNLDDKLSLLRQSLHQFLFASFDTEFPGTIFTTHITFSNLSSSQHYSLMKKNVDSLKIVQLESLSPTLAEAFHHSVPNSSTCGNSIFRISTSTLISTSLKPSPSSRIDHGMDFVKNRDMGIESATFALKFVEYGLGWGSDLRWVTYHRLYNYGYLIKILTGKELPCYFEEFMTLKQFYFGFVHYDMKDMAQELGNYGGLEKICNKFKLERVAGKSHQAGSDSLLTMHLFLLLRKKFFESHLLSFNKFNRMLYNRRHPFISNPLSRPINHVLI